jgi:hypothetical protein
MKQWMNSLKGFNLHLKVSLHQTLRESLQGMALWGGVRKLGGDPQTQGYKDTKYENVLVQNAIHERGDSISQRLLLPRKLWIPLHMPSRPLL